MKDWGISVNLKHFLALVKKCLSPFLLLTEPNKVTVLGADKAHNVLIKGTNADSIYTQSEAIIKSKGGFSFFRGFESIKSLFTFKIRIKIYEVLMVPI